MTLQFNDGVNNSVFMRVGGGMKAFNRQGENGLKVDFNMYFWISG